MGNDVSYVWDFLIDNEYFTEAELALVTSINGYSIETLNDCIYVRYGYRSLDQMLGEDL